MKKLWMVGALVLSVAVLFVLVPKVSAGASASDFVIEGTTLVSYTGTANTVSVPATVEKIGRSAFEENDFIKKVTIPSSVTEIEEYAFWGCDKLETVFLGEGLYEVADFTFTSCPKLNNVYIPDSIRRIGIMAFGDCVSLQEISIPISVTDIHDTAFDGIQNLEIKAELYSYPYRYALARKERLPQEEVPEITPPPIVEEPYPHATPVWTPLPVFVEENVNFVMGSAPIVGNNAVVLVNNTDLDTYYGDEVRLEDFVEQEPLNIKIADWTYYEDSSLKKLQLEEGTTELGAFSFARSGLENMTLPEGLTKIQYAAFYHCDKLEQIYIPESVVRIEAKAFSYTPWMKSFLDGSMQATQGNDFLIVGDGILLAYRGTAKVVRIPEGVKHIAPEAFLNHEEIEEVQFPTTLQSIDSTSFAGCKYTPIF
ncbi:MAG: leucine-rich repeat domain-containing protein [Lachnospiraceae bacterium]|nr:leucine-rich repeat domain-containing protein [Lachnospiraceae bacterium]